MRQKKFGLSGLLVLLVLLTGCAASRLDEAKKQYALALATRAETSLSHYKAALEELDAAIAREPNLWQAYALRGLIHANLDDSDNAITDLDLAQQGSFEGKLQWVPLVMNLTYGDIFHRRAGAAIRDGVWDRAKSYQETALQFFTSVMNTASNNAGVMAQGDELGVAMQDLAVKAHTRWAAGTFQMAVIAGKSESKARQNELLQEVSARLSTVLESYPQAAALRYYLADSYRKQALTIAKTSPAESAQLQAKALSQLRVCGELGLPQGLREPAAQLFHLLSKGAETEVEMKLRGDAAPETLPAPQ